MSNIPLLKGTLVRTKNTAQQQGLSLKQRRNNLRKAFSLNKEIPYQHIALLDDVVTSGNTCNEICRLLLRHSDHQIDVLCLARTPPIETFP